MHGLVNKALKGLAIEHIGEEGWIRICEKCSIQNSGFVSMEPYDDAITYSIVGAISEELELPASEVLRLFGNYWIMHTGQERYGQLLQSLGSTAREFFINLPNLHSRINLVFPQLIPPQFHISHLSENSLHLHYSSFRPGLTDFVYGLIEGIGKMYSTPLTIELLSSKWEENQSDIFKVQW